MTPSTRLTVFARQAVETWTDLLTDRIEPRTAIDRRAEIVSDLHEQIAAARAAGRSDLATAIALLGRAVRGIPADVAWRARLGARAARHMKGTAMSAKPPLQHPSKGEHIEPIRAFDPTNGIAPAPDGIPVEHDSAGRIVAAAVASNTVVQGFFGGGGG